MKVQSIPVFGLLVLAILSLGHHAAGTAQCNPDDFALLCNDGNAVNDAVFNCGFSCFLSSDITSCFADCISDAVPEMSDGCVGCFADQSTCVTNSCFLTCAFGSEADCEACVQTNCQSGFETCAGIVDLDGDGESTVCDCDDANSSVYPGAPGTAQGVDNNCDGTLSPEELACQLDLNADGIITVSDVLTVLAEFGCLIDCTADVNGDGIVTVADILAMLGGFGSDC